MSKDIQKTVALLLKNVVVRNRDIISRRFGLKNGRKETLESIGKSYGITRERVRQIEEFTLKQLSKAIEGNSSVVDCVSWSRDHINSKNGVVKESELLKFFSGQESDSVANASLLFVLTVDRSLIRSSETENSDAFWSLNQQVNDSFKSSLAALVRSLEKNGRVISTKDLYPFVKNSSVPGFNGGELSETDLETCLVVSKMVSKNIFDQVGLVSWPDIKPRGVKDKAYLVLKRANTPKHFSEIAKLINGTGFSNKKANIQTVHNELIKDGRFVLVGRGMYALSEWGYSAGTVKDVLVDILKKSQKPMAKASLVAKVMDARMVKENTILLNLQDSKIFSRKEDGTYSLRKA